MPVSKLELMHDHVRAIHRGVAGGDPPEPGAAPADSKLTFAEVARRFAELEEIARSIASVAQRVPPFSFARRKANRRSPSMPYQPNWAERSLSPAMDFTGYRYIVLIDPISCTTSNRP